MQQQLSGLKELYRHRGAEQALAWPNSGKYLLCASYSEISVWDVGIWSRTCLIEKQSDSKGRWWDSKDRWWAAAWDYAAEIISADSGNEFRMWNPQGELITTQEGFFAKLLRARPVLGGFVVVQPSEDDGRRHNVTILDKSGIVSSLPETYVDVLDVAWSPDGQRLAIACARCVVIVVPLRRGEEFTIAVPGGPSRLIWLDELRIAVGCNDANVRIYRWTIEDFLLSGKEPELFEVLKRTMRISCVLRGRRALASLQPWIQPEGFAYGPRA